MRRVFRSVQVGAVRTVDIPATDRVSDEVWQQPVVGSSDGQSDVRLALASIERKLRLLVEVDTGLRAGELPYRLWSSSW